MNQVARVWLTMGDDVLASCSFDKAGEMIERGHPPVDGRRVIGQLSPCRFGKWTTGPRAVEVIKSRLEHRSAR